VGSSVRSSSPRGRSTCGAEVSGQLGVGDQFNASIPTAVTCTSTFENLPALKQVSLGEFHTACVTEAGQLYSWGHNFRGRLGIGHFVDTYNIVSPVLVEVADGIVMQQVACGRDHTLSICEDGNVYSWGNGYCGQLGHGFEGNCRASDVCVPTRIERSVVSYDGEDFCSSEIVQIAAGTTHSCAVAKAGRIWAWGQGYDGQLGFGKLDDACEPAEVFIPQEKLKNPKQRKKGNKSPAQSPRSNASPSLRPKADDNIAQEQML